MYVCGRDRMYRPILVMKYSVINEFSPLPEPDDVIGAAMITLYFNMKYMWEDGVIENMLKIGDNTGTTIFTLPYKLMKAVMSYITNVNRGRARTVFGLNAPMTISAVWNTVRYFMDENTQQKVCFTTKSTNPMLLQMVHPSQLEEKFGGTAPNRKQGEYWPPRCNSDEFGCGEMTDISNMTPLANDEMLKMSVLTKNEQGLTEE